MSMAGSECGLVFAVETANVVVLSEISDWRADASGRLLTVVSSSPRQDQVRGGQLNNVCACGVGSRMLVVGHLQEGVAQGL